MSRRFWFVTWFLTLAVNGIAIAESRLLTTSEVDLLVTNIPIAVTVKQKGGCPEADYSTDVAPDLAWVKLRNACPRSGNGTLGNYVVNRHSGEIWSDVDRSVKVDSEHLRTLRKKLLEKIGKADN
jgi:hypothetical protein